MSNITFTLLLVNALSQSSFNVHKNENSLVIMRNIGIFVNYLNL